MIGKATWERLSAPAVALTGNRLVLLDEDTTVRFVESGSVALYCVPVEAGRIAGTRELLARIGSGQALFSAALQESEGMRFAFVPAEDSVIREAPLAALWAEMLEHGLPLGGLVDAWLALLISRVEGPGRQDLSAKVAGDGELTLDEGETLAAERGQMLWIGVERGRLQLFGNPDLELAAEQAFFPLRDDLWVRTAEPAQVAIRCTESLPGADELALALGRSHRLALDSLERRHRTALENEVARLRKRSRAQAQRSENAVRELAAVLDPGARESLVQEGGPLLVALAEVGASLGVKIRAPGKSEDLERVGDPIDAIARASRVRTRRVVLSGKWWNRDCGPLLGYTDDEERRPLALVRVRSGYRLFDPVQGTRRRLSAKLAAGLAREAVTLYRPLPEGRLRLVDLLKSGLEGRGGDLRLALFAGMIAALMGMLIPFTTALLMDQAIPDADKRLLVEIGAGLLAVTFGQVVFSFLQGLLLIRIHATWEADTQAALWDRLLSLRSSFFRRFSSGDLQSRVMSVSAISKQLSGATMSSVVSSLMALLNLGLLYYYSPRLASIAVGLGLVVAAFTFAVSAFINRNSRELLEIQGNLFGLEIQLINGVGKLRIAGAGNRAFNHWTKHYGRQLHLWSKNFLLRDSVLLFNVILPTLSNAFLFYFALAVLTERGPDGQTTFSLGTFLAFSAAYGMFLTGVTTLTGTAVNLMDILVRARRVTPILDEEPEVNAAKADPGRLTGKLVVHDVRFRYKEDGPDILEGVSLRAEPGEFVAVVGPSGSGKSTLLRLLLGFETPQAGTVAFDDQELSDVDVVAVRRQLGVVLQGGHLDAGSIFENIACGSVITLDDAWAAAKDAGMADDIKQMPMGMHTIISSGGGNLSGGQRQRLLIARALGQRPKILLFDEATSALDNRTQAIVSESLKRLNVTRIVIAHRLSTIRDADRVYVIQAGKVVQEGRFEDLMAASDGLFARMMQRQIA